MAYQTKRDLGRYMDPEKLGFSTFDDVTIRQAFMRKVYLILMFQLLVTLLIISIFVFVEPIQLFVRYLPELFWVAFGITLVIILALACCEDARRTTPVNYICLGIFTLAESFLLGVISSLYAPEQVFFAVAITAILCLCLTLFAMQTKIDFTGLSGVLFVALIMLLIFGIGTIFMPGNTITMAYSCAGVFLFAVYIIFNTQIMMGGQHKYAISPEEYVFAALTLYIDIVNIFVYILSMIGASNN